ncbi:DUF3572 domain-containing protein [Novosphingobium sp. BL-52-GroH]|uniref:DUF3572 domain-containing protein n=1 Tax=Novosphingobium sp. BL-52-GroH TaxID=3349877 RepID=UPI00384BB1DC
MSSTTRIRFAIRRPDDHLEGTDPAKVRYPVYCTRARLTILRDQPSPSDPQSLALNALGWVLGEQDRAERFLSLTGLTPEDLRASLGEPATLAAVLEFLCQHEPDLLGAADALGIAPQALVAARERLGA